MASLPLRRAHAALIMAQKRQLDCLETPGLLSDPAELRQVNADVEAAEQAFDHESALDPVESRKLVLRQAVNDARMTVRRLSQELRRAERAERRVARTVADREFHLQLAERLIDKAERERALARIPPMPAPAPDITAARSALQAAQERLQRLRAVCRIDIPTTETPSNG